MATLTATGPSSAEPRMRSGAAARLAGISASTLRIWEYRYGVVVPPKSAAGQRTYSMKDVERLRIIKLLTSDGHAISTLANLDVHSLVALSAKPQPSSSDPQKVVVVGRAAARKLEGRLKSQQTLVFDDLNHIERDMLGVGPVDVLVVHVRTLHPDLVARIVGLRKQLLRPQVIVLYSFGAESISESLYAAGMTARREPLTGKELLGLLLAPPQRAESFDSGASSNARRYSDTDLTILAEISSPVSCECPRHLAEIVTLLVAFEEYSTECASQSKKDAVLHRHLREVTARARVNLERALERVVVDEGLSHLVSPSI
jgi:DNA-binding transcriptional MerR regulator